MVKQNGRKFCYHNLYMLKRFGFLIILFGFEVKRIKDLSTSGSGKNVRNLSTRS